MTSPKKHALLTEHSETNNVPYNDQLFMTDEEMQAEFEAMEEELAAQIEEEELLEDLFYEKFQLDDGQRRQEKRRKLNHKSKKGVEVALDELADEIDLENTFETTYTPARFETVWLRDSLQPFYLEGLITDVLMLVKGGKEANVYLCRAHPSTGYDLIAAKVYRPRQFRNLRNDSTYREGREILDSQRGGIVRRRDSREMRALKNKTDFGAQMLHQSWLGYEYNTLSNLFNMGAAVPKPISKGENAMLMEYLGSESMAAPILESVGLEAGEVEPLFNEIMRNVQLMLKKELIHGDLSGYNILYWEGTVTLIDFPQVTSATNNRNAYPIFERDVTRVCEYFAGQGKEVAPQELAAEMWRNTLKIEPGQQIWDDTI